jgi:hypothetical protein
LLVVRANTTHRFLFFEDPNPPICEHDDIEESVDARGVENVPPPIDLARNFATFEWPPGGLNGGPPAKNGVYKV